VLRVPAELFNEELESAAGPIAIELADEPIEIIEVDAAGAMRERHVKRSFRVRVDPEHVQPRPAPIRENHVSQEGVRCRAGFVIEARGVNVAADDDYVPANSVHSLIGGVEKLRVQPR
jgi:hypothetical protein